MVDDVTALSEILVTRVCGGSGFREKENNSKNAGSMYADESYAYQYPLNSLIKLAAGLSNQNLGENKPERAIRN